MLVVRCWTFKGSLGAARTVLALAKGMLFQPSKSRSIAWVRRRTVNRGHSAVSFACYAALIVLILTPACGIKECPGSYRRCDGDVLEVCQEGTENDSWLTTMTCRRGACITDTEGHGFCAEDGSPDARCEGGDKRVCDGSTLLSCYEGYVVDTYDCQVGPFPGIITLEHVVPGPPGGTCLSLSTGARCVDESQRDPECPRSRCDGNDLLECDGEYLVRRTPCESKFCREPHPSAAACYRDAAPDPRCDSSSDSSYCASPSVVTYCSWGYRVSERVCSDRTGCGPFYSQGRSGCP
jgi:hypothetical protein